jgi:tetratricopeptide (TPR) repeat protein
MPGHLVERNTKRAKRAVNATRNGPSRENGDAVAVKAGAKTVAGFSQRINTLFAKGEWAKARALLEKEVLSDPDSHWLLSRLSTTYYEEKDYQKSLDLARQAAALAPVCPLVLWDLAGALDAVGDAEAALAIYRKLIRRGPVAVGTDECGEGVGWGIGLLVDCVYRVGLCLEHLGRTSEALLFYHNFLDLRTCWKEGIYAAVEAKRRIARLGKHQPDYLERELGKLRREMASV